MKISIVFPVFNEQLLLRYNILKVFNFCKDQLSENWQIIISDNGSNDKTTEIGKDLERKYQKIRYIRVKTQGKGEGVISAWQIFPADIYIFMDIDLATDLSALHDLINEIKKGNDIVVGSRFITGAKVSRSLFRKILSYALKLVLKVLLHPPVQDMPCGFKAVNQKVINDIVPKIQNKTWFFDTEMLILAQKAGLKIKDIPIIWNEDTNNKRQSKVGIFKVIKEYIKNIYLMVTQKQE
ncbi:MAG: glycosyltransferase [Thermodesulfobacteriota bacterium]|nr:glycosyltransferase [Thermodesulfobacteriota bacterium]